MRQQWRSVILVIGVAVLMYGLSGLRPARGYSYFSDESRIYLALGAALTAFVVITQRNRP